MNRVSVLLTCDIHTHTYPQAQVRDDLLATRAVLQALGLRCTFFFPARSAELLWDQVEALQQDGHDMGCHGLTHEPTEDYSRLPLRTQRTFLREATHRLTCLLGERPMSFRAPVFKLSGETIRVLDELGYQADLSVNAQRAGVFGSDLYNLRPLFAHRRPYHPDPQNPFRHGGSSLWEIPTSAWVVPFISNTERAFGLGFIRVFFWFLYCEARLTGKPIVFMFHAEDLNKTRGIESPGRLSWRHFLPTRTYGFEVRYFLLEQRWDHVHRDLVALLRYMQAFPGLQFLTTREYLQILNGRDASERSEAQVPPHRATALVAGASGS
jgi:hypothetical protein